MGMGRIVLRAGLGAGMVAATTVTALTPAADASTARPSVSRLSSSMSATRGGETITVYGHHLGRGAKVYFGKTRSPHVVMRSSTQLRVVVPSHAVGAVSVSVHLGSRHSASTSHARFTYEPPPTLTGLSVTRGDTGGGTRLTVSGNGFDSSVRVLFGSAVGSAVHVVSARSLTVTTPRQAASVVTVRAQTRWGSSGSARFAYTVPLPVTDARAVTSTQSAQTITWTSPRSTDFASVVVRQAGGTTAPATAVSGSAVTVRGTTATATGLAMNSVYSYAVFARDHDGQYSAPARLTVRTPDCTPTVRHLGGTLSTQTLTAHCVSSYVLDDTVTVPAGTTLTLDPGVTLTADSGAGIDVAGTLVADGIDAAPVTFTAADPAGPAAWPGITVEDGATATLTGTTVRHASTALEVADGADVVVRGRILDSTLGIDSQSAVVDARHVDWGSTDGPSPIGHGTPVSGSGVFATPWTGFTAPARPAPSTPDTTPPADTTCGDVVFIGARGSGEGPQGDAVHDPTVSERDLMGTRVTPILDALTQARPDLHVRAVGLRYPAAPPPFASFSGFSTSYLASIYAGVDQLEATLAREHQRCPAEQIVLAGFSQGALVVHLALAELDAQGTLDQYPVIAVELVADPARTSTDTDTRDGDNTTDWGTAPTDAAGIWTTIFGPTPLPASLADSTAETCHAHDAVCATADPDTTPPGHTEPGDDGYRLDPTGSGAAHVSYDTTGELTQLGQHAAARA